MADKHLTFTVMMLITLYTCLCEKSILCIQDVDVFRSFELLSAAKYSVVQTWMIGICWHCFIGEQNKENLANKWCARKSLVTEEKGYVLITVARIHKFIYTISKKTAFFFGQSFIKVPRILISFGMYCKTHNFCCP